MDPLELAQIGTTDVYVTRLGFGGAPLGAASGPEGTALAVETVKRGYELGLRFFDTAPLYGKGKSERFYGSALSAFDRNSLARMGLDRLDIVLIHDPDDHWEQAIGEAYPTLAYLRSQGIIGAIGAGMNEWEMLERFAREGDFDCFLLAGRYTLLDHSGLDVLLPLCQEKQISVILGGPYNSGVLASDLGPDTTYFYQRTPPEVLETAKIIKAVRDRHNVPLQAAALQFGLAHPAVAATIPGPRAPTEVEENVAMAGYEIPSDLWSELKAEGLIPQEAPVPE